MKENLKTIFKKKRNYCPWPLILTSVTPFNSRESCKVRATFSIYALFFLYVKGVTIFKNFGNVDIKFRPSIFYTKMCANIDDTDKCLGVFIDTVFYMFILMLINVHIASLNSMLSKSAFFRSIKNECLMLFMVLK